MRISDWSSDVCSSDLRHVAHRHLALRHSHFQIERGLVRRLVPRRNETARVGILELGVQRTLLARPGVVVDREQAVGLGPDLAGEIGSASCRERECQYVKNSVGSGSLKKKYKKKKTQYHR